MKTRLAIIISLLMLSILTITASAAKLTATTESKSCAIGSTVTINVSLSESATAMSGGIEVVYDKTKLQLIDAKWNTDGSLKNVLLKTFDFNTNLGAFSFAGDSNISKGKIFSATFRVLSDAPLGDTQVECIVQIKDSAGENIALNNVAGKITVTCNHSFTLQTLDYPSTPATCTAAARYYYSCSRCGIKGNSTYAVGEPAAHIYNRRVATEEYLVNSVDCVDTAEYYYSCECGAKGEEKYLGDASWTHSFGADWFVGASGHWHACTDCGTKKDYSDHEVSNDICSVCFFVIESEGEHTHSYSVVLKTDDTGHWYDCICGNKRDYALHNYDDGKVTKNPTQSEKGEKTFVCQECYHVKTEEIPMLEVEEDEPPIVEQPEEKPDNTLATVLITICSIIGIEAIACVVYVVIKKRGVAILKDKSAP